LHWHAELASLGCRLNDQIAEGQMGQGVSIKRVPKRNSPLVLVGAGNPAGVAPLYVGKKEGNELPYMGKVGTGWSRTVSSQIRK
jgi:hypothetical protein